MNNPTKPAALPQLREDIRLLKDAPAPSGAPRWLLHDPARDTFFEIGLEAFQLISLWSRVKSAKELADLASQQTGRTITEEEVAEFSRYLNQMRLTQEATGGWRELSNAADAQRHGVLSQILHNYLFFKMPLVSPSAFLSKTLPSVRILASRTMLAVFAVLSMIGLYFASRQWGDVTDGLQRQLTLSGAMLFAATLFVMKIFHELGHAYVATAYGCRVRSMGIAVMMMAPMLYTDVTEAWRLPERKKRMAIDLAGVVVELVIAGLALFAWAFLPPGDARDTALVIATAAVIMTLVINLSPFMRFDGYYVFADMLGVKNLQSRAFALVRWKMREWLFNLGAPSPDTMRGRLRSTVIVYGVLTMIYRLFLFVGIAVLVYTMSFKMLGILLFLVEIGYFVALPVWREMKVWWSLRREIVASPRMWLTTFAAIMAITITSVPWSTHVTIPAVMEPAQFVRLFPSAPGEISTVHVRMGSDVKAGDLLVTLASPRLEKELVVIKERLHLIQERLARRVGDRTDQSQSLSLDKDRLSLLERLDALMKQMDTLSIHAPLAGKVAELDPNLHAGRLLARDEEIGIILAGNSQIVRGFADQQDLWRLKPGQTGRFIPDNAQVTPVNLSLTEVTLSASNAIDIPHLAETYGGKLRAHPQQPNQPLVPIDPIHQIRLSPDQVTGSISRPQRGIAIVEGAPQSMVASLWRRALKVLMQEAGA